MADGGQRMNAIPQIELRAVVRPAYDNRNVARGALWISDNLQALRDYYEALGGALPNETSANAVAEFPRAQRFVAWCACQWDIERFKP